MSGRAVEVADIRTVEISCCKGYETVLTYGTCD